MHNSFNQYTFTTPGVVYEIDKWIQVFCLQSDEKFVFLVLHS